MISIESILMVIVSIIIALLAFKLVRFSRGGRFEKCWKPLYLIPFFMLGIVICEILEVEVIRVRAFFALMALIVMALSIYWYYKVWRDLMT